MPDPARSAQNLCSIGNPYLKSDCRRSD